MKYWALIFPLALAACNTTVDNTSLEAPDVPEKQAVAEPVLSSVLVTNKKPTYGNRSLFMKTSEWKDKHFEHPNRQYGNITYYYFSRVAKVGSAECGLTLDAHYVSGADAIGRRAIFQNRDALKAKLKEVDAKFSRDYGPFGANDQAARCRAMRQNIADKTLLGALFFTE